MGEKADLWYPGIHQSSLQEGSVPQTDLQLADPVRQSIHDLHGRAPCSESFSHRPELAYFARTLHMEARKASINSSMRCEGHTSETARMTSASASRVSEGLEPGRVAMSRSACRCALGSALPTPLRRTQATCSLQALLVGSQALCQKWHRHSQACRGGHAVVEVTEAVGRPDLFAPLSLCQMICLCQPQSTLSPRMAHLVSAHALHDGWVVRLRLSLPCEPRSKGRPELIPARSTPNSLRAPHGCQAAQPVSCSPDSQAWAPPHGKAGASCGQERCNVGRRVHRAEADVAAVHRYSAMPRKDALQRLQYCLPC